MQVSTPDAFFDMLRFSQVTGMAVLRTQEKVWGGMLDMVSTQTAWLAPLAKNLQESQEEAAAEVQEAMAELKEDAEASLHEAAAVIEESAGAVLAAASDRAEAAPPPEAPLPEAVPLRTKRVKKS